MRTEDEIRHILRLVVSAVRRLATERNDAVKVWKERAQKAEAEVAHLSEILARRPALDDEATLAAKAEKCISTAKKVDAYRAALEKYADKQNWTPAGEDAEAETLFFAPGADKAVDGFAIAREALNP